MAKRPEATEQMEMTVHFSLGAVEKGKVKFYMVQSGRLSPKTRNGVSSRGNHEV